MADARLAEIGRKTAARLAANPTVQKVAGQGLDLWVVQNFLTATECGGLIAMIDADRQPSKLYATRADAGFRTSESCNLDRWHPFVRCIDARLCDMLGMRERQGETLQGQRYAPGQLFRAHHDYFHTDQHYWRAEKARGGQRSWTAMIYLDEPGGGGETWFSAAGLRVSPRRAMLLAWNNMADDGAPNPAALHESLAVEAGLKNIVTKWFRAGDWC